ncbi:YdeI/OmpD-associated family protein [Leekyejoonella antrihumi]|uniref:Bacteriocin-protection protein n=1 Tax=Leekyejoonella antrihumi TaxID=1660198 RepID=A0A563E9X7_9MICO|nr:YdeI/OmpD-associated family protein [Leekyejoonella antrihumi]TWP39011.1 hypothetical protein FGL98_01055 [Leekyejoonella antrihumi]
MTTPGSVGGAADRPVVFFEDAAQWRAWLQAHHDRETSIWMGLHKKHVQPRGLQWTDAVKEALCFGWIDSQVQRIDDDTVRQRWTPRKPGSIWSNVNVELVEALISEGRMTPAGRAAYAARSAERTGVYSHEGAHGDSLPDDFAARLAGNELASIWWEQMPPSWRRKYVSWVVSAKRPQTRDLRVRQLVEDSAAGRLVKPFRYGAAPGWVSRARRAMDLD